MQTARTSLPNLRGTPIEYDIEDGLVRLRIFEKDTMPRLAHRLCPDCLTRAQAEVERASPPYPADG